MIVAELYKFQFTHPGRGATSNARTNDRQWQSFNSRTPGGVRLPFAEADVILDDVSIHAPREGCDTEVCKRRAIVIAVSIHAPREGCDLNACTHLHRSYRRFNSRTPGGVRLRINSLISTRAKVSIHAPREGCDW